MTVLGAIRDELAALLRGAGVPAVAGEPPRPAPPQAQVFPGGPYLEAGDAFGRRLIRLRVRLVVPMSDRALDALDELLEAALPALEADVGADALLTGDAWRVTEVSEPFTLVANQVTYPAVDVTVVTSTSEI